MCASDRLRRAGVCRGAAPADVHLAKADRRDGPQPDLEIAFRQIPGLPLSESCADGAGVGSSRAQLAKNDVRAQDVDRPVDVCLAGGDVEGQAEPARSPARASALARTTSGSCRPGGRTPCHRCSRRTRSQLKRICCTVSHLPDQPPRLRVADNGQPGRLAWLFGDGTDPGRHGASPEGGGRVEFRRAAIGHPKVLPARRGGGSASGSRRDTAGPRRSATA
jgi:hypothetical protein